MAKNDEPQPLDELLEEEEMGDVPTPLSNAVRTGDELTILRALLKFAARELEGNRCSKCQMSNMNTGQIASIMNRMENLIERINKLDPPAVDEEDPLAEIQNRPRLTIVAS